MRRVASPVRPAVSERTRPAALPTYALYGEAGRTQATDWLHCEAIADRSQRHDWEIRPHRHAALLQILHIHRGQAQAWLDGEQQALAGPCVLLLPALVPHGFVFAPGVEGTVVTVLEAHLARLLQATPALAACLGQRCLLAWPVDGEAAADGAAEAVDAAVAQLKREFGTSAPWRELALDSALLQLVLLLGRQVEARGLPAPPARADAPGAPAAVPGARALAHVRRLRALVEAGFRQQPALAELAAQLGITPTQLNRVCHQVLGHSALGVLHGRLVLEAQRDLAYTTLSVKQIALGLGFGDAAYFSRFFQRQTGLSPSAWRARSAS